MKLIQAMKKIKDLATKAADLREKVARFHADLSIETPTYADQKRQVSEWIQSHHDLLKEILGLRVSIQRTNLLTQVTIELNGHQVTKPIAAWIHRRRDLANLERDMWLKLNDRGLKEQNVQTTPGGVVTEIRVRRYYEPTEKDRMLGMLQSEPATIDGTLEVINATTELIEQ